MYFVILFSIFQLTTNKFKEKFIFEQIINLFMICPKFLENSVCNIIFQDPFNSKAKYKKIPTTA